MAEGKGRHTGACGIDGRRCCECRKLAKDLIDGEYLCRIHSPMRKGFADRIKAEKKKK